MTPFPRAEVVFCGVTEIPPSGDAAFGILDDGPPLAGVQTLDEKKPPALPGVELGQSRRGGRCIELRMPELRDRRRDLDR